MLAPNMHCPGLLMTLTVLYAYFAISVRIWKHSRFKSKHLSFVTLPQYFAHLDYSLVKQPLTMYTSPSIILIILFYMLLYYWLEAPHR